MSVYGLRCCIFMLPIACVLCMAYVVGTKVYVLGPLCSCACVTKTFAVDLGIIKIRDIAVKCAMAVWLCACAVCVFKAKNDNIMSGCVASDMHWICVEFEM